MKMKMQFMHTNYTFQVSPLLTFSLLILQIINFIVQKINQLTLFSRRIPMIQKHFRFSFFIFLIVTCFSDSWTLQSITTQNYTGYDDFGNNCAHLNSCCSKFNLTNGQITKIFTICTKCDNPDFTTFILPCQANKDGFHHYCTCCFDAFYMPYLLAPDWCLDQNNNNCTVPKNNYNTDSYTNGSSGSDTNTGAIIGGVVGGIIVIVVIIVAIVCYIKRRAQNVYPYSSSSPTPPPYSYPYRYPAQGNYILQQQHPVQLRIQNIQNL